jgi:GTP-binding protein HflX
VQADLLLHVVDAAHPGHDQQVIEVDRVLGEIGAGDIAQVLVFNKIDVLGFEPEVKRDECGSISRIWLSARNRSGLDAVRAAIRGHIERSKKTAAA